MNIVDAGAAMADTPLLIQMVFGAEATDRWKVLKG